MCGCCGLKGSGSRADLTTARSEGFPEPEIEKARRSEPVEFFFATPEWPRSCPSVHHPIRTCSLLVSNCARNWLYAATPVLLFLLTLTRCKAGSTGDSGSIMTAACRCGLSA
jgi:hypothetical protein